MHLRPHWWIEYIFTQPKLYLERPVRGRWMLLPIPNDSSRQSLKDRTASPKFRVRVRVADWADARLRKGLRRPISWAPITNTCSVSKVLFYSVKHRPTFFQEWSVIQISFHIISMEVATLAYLPLWRLLWLMCEPRWPPGAEWSYHGLKGIDSEPWWVHNSNIGILLCRRRASSNSQSTMRMSSQLSLTCRNRSLLGLATT